MYSFFIIQSEKLMYLRKVLQVSGPGSQKYMQITGGIHFFPLLLMKTH